MMRNGEPDTFVRDRAADNIFADSPDEDLAKYSPRRPAREPARTVETTNIEQRESGVGPKSDEGDSSAQSQPDLPIEVNQAHINDQIVRRNFPVSPSVEAQCATHPIPNKEECVVVKNFLRQLMLQRRDEPWASSTEAKLRDHAAQISADVEIRALECRETLCAMEVSTVMGNLDLLSWREVFALGVDDWSHFLMGYEPEASGVQKKVFLRVYERR